MADCKGNGASFWRKIKGFKSGTGNGSEFCTGRNEPQCFMCMRRGGRFEVHQTADAGEEPICNRGCSSCLFLLIPALLLQAQGELYGFTDDWEYSWHHTGGHCLSSSSCHALSHIAALHLSGCHRELETSLKSHSQTQNLWPAWLIDTCPNPPPLSCYHCISNA